MRVDDEVRRRRARSLACSEPSSRATAGTRHAPRMGMRIGLVVGRFEWLRWRPSCVRRPASTAFAETPRPDAGDTRRRGAGTGDAAGIASRRISILVSRRRRLLRLLATVLGLATCPPPAPHERQGATVLSASMRIQSPCAIRRGICVMAVKSTRAKKKLQLFLEGGSHFRLTLQHRRRDTDRPSASGSILMT